MEFITGLKQQEEAELEDLLKAEEGTTIILEGAVHSIRDMGEIAFVILRKREGLIQKEKIGYAVLAHQIKNAIFQSLFLHVEDKRLMMK